MLVITSQGEPNKTLVSKGADCTGAGKMTEHYSPV